MKHGDRESDHSIVSKKPRNKAAPAVADGVERRERAKGNTGEQTRSRTQRRADLNHALDRVREAEQRKDGKLTALWHHVYNVDRLREAYFGLKRNAAPGIDGQSWQSYGEDLEANLADLSLRLQRGSYRAYAVKRCYVEKADGSERPIGIPVLEDKIVQRATTEVLGAVYEPQFKGFSYGFRPGRSPHDALDAVSVGIERRRINWILDADISGFFDALDHDWLLEMIAHRIADRRILRHIKKWLKAGVMEEGHWSRQEAGTPQGGSISPLLANIYLHYVLDLWADKWRKERAAGDVIIVRYADDFIVGFEHEEEAQRYRDELEARLGKFGLTLHRKKTRLIEFGRHASSKRRDKGLGKPETFDFLGFTHICSQSRNGRFTVRRQTMKTRIQRKLKMLKQQLRSRINWSIPDLGRWLRSVLQGHYRYYGVPMNYAKLEAFHKAVTQLWFKLLRRRSHKSKLTKERRSRLVRRWLPYPKIMHPYPSNRLRVG